jgi:hypothetical protein
MAKAAEHRSTLKLTSLADVLRHVVLTVKPTPEADIKSEIIEEMHSGRLPHLVDRRIEWLSRPLSHDEPFVMPKAEVGEPVLVPREPPKPPPMQVVHGEPMPSEVFAVSKEGLGSLQIDWHNSRAVRRAGAEWPRIDFEGIRCSREHLLMLWPPPAAGRSSSRIEGASAATEADAGAGCADRVVDPINSEAAIQSAGIWLEAAVNRVKNQHDCPSEITAVARILAKEMATALKAGKVARAWKSGTIKNRLLEWGLWPRRRPTRR